MRRSSGGGDERCGGGDEKEYDERRDNCDASATPLKHVRSSKVVDRYDNKTDMTIVYKYCRQKLEMRFSNFASIFAVLTTTECSSEKQPFIARHFLHIQNSIKNFGMEIWVLFLKRYF